MPQAVTVYRWDDAGAPQIPNGKPSQILDVLTKCLVDGYGSKAPLGWTRPYYDAGVQAAVFRNNVAAGGSGGFAKFYSNTAADANNTVMRVTHAASMTGISDFFRQGNTQAFTATSGLTRWVLIGTSIGFYLTIDTNLSTLKMTGPGTYGVAMYVGDFYSAVPSDTSRFITMASFWNGAFSAPASEDSLYYMRATGDSAIRTPLKIYDADNFDAFSNYCLWLPFWGNTGGINNIVWQSEPTSPEVLMPAFVWLSSQNILSITTDRLGQIVRDSTVSPLLRGVLPGYGYSLKVGYGNTLWPFSKTISSQQHWLMRSYTAGGYTSAGAFINMEQWNDPFGNV